MMQEPLDPDLIPSRRTVWIEDALILLGIPIMWLAIFELQGAWVRVVLWATLAVMIVLLIRRKRRIDRLFEELRRRQRRLQEMGGFPTIPGMMPPERLQGPPHERPVDQSRGVDS